MLFEVSQEHVNEINDMHRKFDNVQPIPGIQNIHVIRCHKDGIFEFCVNALHIDDMSEERALFS